MTPARFTSDELNAAINTAARQMTSAAPSPELRARVLSKLDAAQPRWGWRLAIAGGAIGVVAIAAALTWRVQPIAVSSPAVASATAFAPGAETDAPVYWIAPPSHVTLVMVAGFRDTATTVMPNVAELDWQTRAVPQLPALDALTIERIVQTDISIDPIDIAPLVVPPLPSSGAGSR